MLSDKADRDKPFDPVDYCKKALWMFDGDIEEQEVILASENKHMISLIDRFGEEIPVNIIDDHSFQTIVKVIPSYTFFSWVFQFCGEIRIIGPGNVKKEYEEMLQRVLERQQ